MDTEFSIPAAFIGFALVLAFLCVYTFLLFFIGSIFGKGGADKPKRLLVYFCSAAGSVSIAMTSSLLPISTVLKVGVATIFVLANAVPFILGFLSAVVEHEAEERRNRERHTMELLMDWERDRLMRTGEYRE